MKFSYRLLLAIMALTISLFWGVTSGKKARTTAKAEATTGASTTGPKKNGTGKKLKPCTCHLNYQPECGKDGKTYDNKCMRECEGVEMQKSGDCEGKFAALFADITKNENGTRN